MGDLEPYEDRRPVLPELIDYLRADRYRRDLESDRPIININYYEAPRPEPAPPPAPGPLAKYTEYMILYLGFAIIAGIFAVIFMIMATAIMTVVISLAVCAIAVAASVRSLRMSKEEARAVARGRRSR